MAEESDVLDDAGTKALVAMTQLAAAALAARGSTLAERDLARALLSGMSARETPAEIASVATEFNREMDVVLNAANASHGARARSTRRCHMARALELESLILVDKGTLAGLFADTLALDVARARIEQLEAAASGNAHYKVDAALLAAATIATRRASKAATGLAADVLARTNLSIMAAPAGDAAIAASILHSERVEPANPGVND